MKLNMELSNLIYKSIKTRFCIMSHRFFIVFVLLLGVSALNVYPQETDANIFGDVVSEGEHVPFCNVYIKGTNYGTVTDHTGHYMLTNLPAGKHILVAQMLGYISNEQEVSIELDRSIEINFVLKESNITLEQVVVTGTRTKKKISEAPIMVNILDGKTLSFTQSNTVSEGLCFQPGLRVEVDCQTCNYTQLRMNGLGGSYSQILINNQPVFSALNGLYGLEQIPANMIDRIEVVRGGGSALYGSSAIAGTVNIITKNRAAHLHIIVFPGSILYSLEVRRGRCRLLHRYIEYASPRRR